MQVKSIAEGEHSAILLSFIKLSFVIMIIVLSIFEWPFYTGFTVCLYKQSGTSVNQDQLASYKLADLDLHSFQVGLAR